MPPTYKLASAALFEGRQQPWRFMQAPWSTLQHIPAVPTGHEAQHACPPRPSRPEFPIKSMICDDEVLFLYYLASQYYTGTGAIIDMGPLAGGSTYAMASGISAGHIHSYDLWQYFEGFEGYFGPMAKSLDLLEEFNRNLGNLAQKVTAHRGDILKQNWTGEPIEIMFIDAAKSTALMHYIANEFFPCLRTGAYVVQQDFVSAEDPWIHIAMGVLADYFEIMDSPEGGTVCFRVKKAIPPNPLPPNYFEGQRHHIRAARQKLLGWHGLCIELAEANYLALNGLRREAQTILDAVQEHPLYETARFAYDVRLVQRALKQAVRA
jgi:hypothetical protein